MSEPAPLDFAADAGTAPSGAGDDRPQLEVRHRGLLLLSVMVISITQYLDSTIANVALPHMKVSLGASNDSISWVLTSYIIGGAIFMPITGWLSDRIGSRNLFIGAAVVFLVASAASGAATSLPEMVIFRAIQGISTAFIGPMTQTILFDASPPSKQAATMSYFGMLVMVAPISGPFLGGYLTETLNWRWNFYVNLPIGVPALLVVWWLLPSRPLQRRRLDMFGFVALAVALGAVQLLLDRGNQKDWFDSWEIILEAFVAISAFWIYLVHTFLFVRTDSTDAPLFNPKLITNPNFIAAMGMMFILGLTNVGLSAVLPTMYQTIYGYSVIDSGLLMAPRGFGVIIMSQVSVYLMRRLDYRLIITIGYLVAAYSVHIMTTWSPQMSAFPIIEASFIQGLGLGLIFAPMNILAFGSIDPQLRPDGSSLMQLFRNVGGSFGISAIMTMLAHNQQTSHSDLASRLTPGEIPTVDLTGTLQTLQDAGAGVAQMLDAEVSKQAAMIAYIDNFDAIFWLLLAIAPLPFLLRKPTSAVGPSETGRRN